jgi:Holin of 3TMs, for gene-transfer release
MGILNFLFGGGARQIAKGAAEVGRVFVGDKAAREAQGAAAYQAALGQFGAEVSRPARTWFDGLVDGLNRLPRPILAFSILGLFGFAMLDPVSFAARMQGLALIPEPLWWIIGTVIAFYFGARETFKAREFRAATRSEVQATVSAIREIEAIPGPEDEQEAAVGGNAALRDWLAQGVLD